MAVKFFEGFDAMKSDGSDLAQDGWVQTNTGSKQTGRVNGSSLRFGSSITWSYSLGTTFTQLIAGFGFNLTSVAATVDIFRFLDAAAAVQCGLSLNGATQKLFFWKGTNATVLATGTTSIASATWYYIELSIPFSNAASIECRLNGSGSAEFSANPVDTTNTANQNAQSIQLVGTASSAILFDDLYVCDTSASANGSAPSAVTFLGDTRVETLFPSANSSVQFTPLSSTNVSQVSEAAVDDDTSYNSTATSSQIDLFTIGSLSSNPTTIWATRTRARMRKDDAATRNGRSKLKSNATTVDGTNTTLTTSYLWVGDAAVQDVDPNGNIAWAKTAVNAALIGYENV